jgi:hypothetical protein
MKDLGLSLSYLKLLAIATLFSCAGRQYPEAAPTKMNVAVVKLTSIDHKGEELGYCTGWKLDDNRMVTAGHCCVYDKPADDADELEVLLGLAKTKEVEVPHFTMFGPYAIPGETAKPVYRDMKHDICILEGHMRGAPIVLANRDPEIGARVFTAGYPRTTFLISEGLWSGRDDDGQAVASIAIWGGASGSPVLDDQGRAVGVSVAMWTGFDSLAFIAPLEWLRIADMTTRK